MSGFIQNGSVNAVTSGVNHPTIGSVTASNTLICVYQVNNAVTLSAPTDSSGQTWSLALNFNAQNQTIGIAYLLSANSGTHTLTWASQTNASESCISEWNGITGIGNTAVTASNPNTSSLTTGSYTPSQANEVIIALLGEFGSNSSDQVQCTTAGFQSIGSLSDFGSHSCIGIEQNGASFGCMEGNAQIVTSASAVTCSWSWTPGNESVCGIVGFKYTPGGSGVTVAITGQTSTSSAGTFSPATAVAVTGQTSTSSAGTLTATPTVAITGQSGTFSAGSMTSSRTLALTGSTATFTAGTMVATSSLAISGLSASFAAGTLLPAISMTLTGQTATFGQGTFSVGGNVTVALNGQTATWSAGTVTPSAAVAASGLTATYTAGTLTPGQQVSLSGLTATSSAGNLTPSSTLALSGLTSTYTAGALIPGIQAALTGLTATYSAGTFTPSVNSDVTVALTGLTAAWSAGQFGTQGGTAVSTGAGRRVRSIYRITIDGVVFECRTYAEAVALLDKAKETAIRIVEDRSTWAVTRKVSAPLELPKITVNTRDLRPAVQATKREIKTIYDRALQAAEIRLLMELTQQREDEEMFFLLL